MYEFTIWHEFVVHEHFWKYMYFSIRVYQWWWCYYCFHTVWCCPDVHAYEKMYKVCVLICLKSEVIQLTSFSTNNLLEVTSVTLVTTYLENIFHTVLLSIYCMNAFQRKRIFWIHLFGKFEKVPLILVVDIAVEECVLEKRETYLESLFSLVQSLQYTLP